MVFATVLAAWAGDECAVASRVAMIALRSIALPLWAVASGRTVAERQCAVQSDGDERRVFSVEARCGLTNRDPDRGRAQVQSGDYRCGGHMIAVAAMLPGPPPAEVRTHDGPPAEVQPVAVREDRGVKYMNLGPSSPERSPVLHGRTSARGGGIFLVAPQLIDYEL